MFTYYRTSQQNFQENMKRLRHIQQQHEQELIAKGIMPHTSEEAIKKYAEQQRTQMITDKIVINNSISVSKRISFI